MPTAKRIYAIAAFVALSLSAPALGQGDKGTPILFHVTAVRSEDAKDWCTTGECSATRYTVEGYSDVKGDSSFVEYVMDCVQVMAEKPSPHYTVLCDRVHARGDYDATLFANAITFSPPPKNQPSDAPIQAAYQIVSEKEVTKQKK